MERKEHPSRLFHGTSHEVHTTGRPFLDPRLAGGYDDGDPDEGHVFATPDMIVASIFAFKDTECLNILKTDDELVVVYDGRPPSPDAEGFVYEVPPVGFKQTTHDGRPTGKWAMVESEMPLVIDGDGGQTPGISLTDPVRRVAIRDLIEQDHLRVCVLTDVIDADTYSDALSDAIESGAVNTFIHEAIGRGWLRDITSTFLQAPQHGDDAQS